jgi:hypothetical protein
MQQGSGGRRKNPDSEINADIVAYPNPVSDRLYININPEKVKSVEVYDIYGKVCSAAVVNPSSPLLEISMSGLSNGLYIVKLNKGDRTESFRIIKQ